MKPPEDAGDEWLWDDWANEMRYLALPGWSTCRFAVRRGDRAAFMFGITRGPFGIWGQQFEVCSADADLEVTNHVPTWLYTLVHLPSGAELALFYGQGEAALAADTALRACFEWTHEDVPQPVRDRTSSVWVAMGIVDKDLAHAHDRAGRGPFYIKTLVPPEANRPEKVS